MTTTYAFPIPPSANRYWRMVNGRVLVSEAARVYKQVVWALAHQQDMQLVTGSVAINIRVYRAQKTGDIDNYLKVLLDALKGLAYQDDKQIVEIHAYRFDDKDDPRVLVTINEVTQ